VSSALTEIAQTANVGMVLNESSIPISEGVKGACEILSPDPLYVANEGKLLAIVANENVAVALRALRSLSLGEKATVIGEVVDEHPGFSIQQAGNLFHRSGKMPELQNHPLDMRVNVEARRTQKTYERLVAVASELDSKT
jgi:hydrogenase maturation factor